MLLLKILSVATLFAVTVTLALDVMWSAGDPGDCDNDCSGEKETVDSVSENVCSDIGTMKSCIQWSVMTSEEKEQCILYHVYKAVMLFDMSEGITPIS